MNSLDITAQKHRGNTASNDAYSLGAPHHCAVREAIFTHLQQFGPMTSKEIGRAFSMSLHTFSGRLSEMRRSGRIRGTGERRGNAEILEIVSSEDLESGEASR